MSSISVDASGSRPLTTTVNDPQATKAWMPSRQDDDATIQINSAAQIAFMVPPSARIVRRRTKDFTFEEGKRVEAGERDLYFVVLGDAESEEPSQSLFVMVKNRQDEEAAKLHPHVAVVARKEMGSFVEPSGEFVEEQTLAALMGDLTAG